MRTGLRLPFGIKAVKDVPTTTVKFSNNYVVNIVKIRISQFSLKLLEK